MTTILKSSHKPLYVTLKELIMLLKTVTSYVMLKRLIDKSIMNYIVVWILLKKIEKAMKKRFKSFGMK